MNRYQTVVIITLCVVASHLLASGASADLPNRLLARNFNIYSSPSPAGNMVLQDLKGRAISLSALRGKVVILNFWKIDCPPCSLEKPILERIYRKLGDRGLEILAVNLFDGYEKQRIYSQRNGFSFTFAFDGGSRVTVRQQKTGSGPPTTFVVNSNSEAIYEIPGVPTTYLINRNGQVVGSSVGLVNWEEEPFQELLESLLSRQTETVAQNPAFTDAARDGARTQFATLDDSGSRIRSLLTQDTPASRDSQQTLPFQGPTRGPVAGPTVQPAPPAAGERTAPTPPPPHQSPKPSAAIPPPKKKPVQQADKTDLRTPRPYKPAKPSTAAAQPVQPAGRAPTAKTLPSAGPVPPSSTVVGGGTRGALPPLPPAIPYSPTAPNAPGAQQTAPMVPDESGRVTARIPGLSEAGTYPGQRSAAGLPPAQPVPIRNPIDNFILDSFKPSSGQTQTQAPQPLHATGGEQPASSVIDQMGRDVRQLGAGIRDTFSRILPGGR